MSCFHALTNAECSGLILLASLQTPPSDPLAVSRPWSGSGGRHSHQVGCLLVHFFFAHVFPLKLSNTMCFILGFVLCFTTVTSYPSPPQTRCFPPPQNCPLFFSGFCLSRVLHLIHLSVRSIITFSTIFDDYDQKKTYNFLKHITPVTSSDHYNFIR